MPDAPLTIQESSADLFTYDVPEADRDAAERLERAVEGPTGTEPYAVDPIGVRIGVLATCPLPTT